MALLVLAFRADEPLAPPSRHRIDTAAETTVGRGSARSVERRADRDLVLRVADARMSSTHFVIRRSEQGFVVRDQGSRNGTLRNGEVVAEAALEDGDVLEAGRTFFVFRELEEKGDALLRPDDGPGRVALPVLATMAVPLAEVFRSVERVASSKLTVLLEAESGTGKELVARAVHALSGRKGPFVAVNCGAIPSNLVETELFGYRKGAFSGANEDRPGLVRSAAGGTLFLDELGDLPLAAQSAFLRLLQEREVTPVGDHRAVPVDVRVVTATHRHLASAAERGTFRADLLARLAGFTVHLPALRERREDLGLLTAAFLGRFASDPAVAVSFTLAAARALFAHAWPLNVRELEKCIERALVIAGGKPLDLEHFPELTGAPGECVRSSAAAAVADSSALPLRPLTADEQKHREALLVLLRQHSGNISAVARATGKARNQIQRWIRRYGISREG